MHPKQHRLLWIWLSVSFFGSACLLNANDSAASRAAGGIQLRREANISMEKERLEISESKVTVEYEFLNDTNNDVTTDVAFPIPPYDYGFSDAAGRRDFGDFRLWVEGRELKYKVAVRAKVGDSDYTDLLKNLGIDILSFGGWDEDRNANPIGPITQIPKQQLQHLTNIGLIDSDRMLPLWDVVKTYYWKQTFPAHKILHIRHEYTPSIGFEEIGAEELDPAKKYPGDIRGEIKNACIDPSLSRTLMAEIGKYKPGEMPLGVAWVNYILTTANSWRTPIKDFTLIIDRRNDSKSVSPATTQYVSLCWDGPIEKLDANRFLMHKINFLPKKELNVAFFDFIVHPDK